jgi:tripartite ATP-independent transporter DctM subunit
LPVGELFRAAVLPGLALVGLYCLYVLAWTRGNPQRAPSVPFEGGDDHRYPVLQALRAVVPPLLLIVVVLGSIFAGIATPTESSALGGAGAIALAVFYRRFSLRMLFDSARATVEVTAMVFAILLGATAFSMAFTYTGGDTVVEQFLLRLPGEQWGFLIFSMLFILALGFFIDFVEISFIVVPILAPVAEALGISMLWFAILIAMNLQTSFLTPPFGFSLFYLKGVAPAEVRTTDIYRGVVPFIAMQVAILGSVLVFPELYGLG